MASKRINLFSFFTSSFFHLEDQNRKMKQTNWEGKSVLIIDHKKEEANIIGNILVEVGFHCIFAKTGYDGIQAAHLHQPDIILLDWSIPEIDGNDLIEQLKTTKDTRIIPIVVLTGSNLSNEDLCKVLCDKADDYLRQPIDRFELIGRVAACLRLYRVIGIVQERSERLAQLNYDLQIVAKQS